jgi:hypothetical protein
VKDPPDLRKAFVATTSLGMSITKHCFLSRTKTLRALYLKRYYLLLTTSSRYVIDNYNVTAFSF